IVLQLLLDEFHEVSPRRVAGKRGATLRFERVPFGGFAGSDNERRIDLIERMRGRSRLAARCNSRGANSHEQQTRNRIQMRYSSTRLHHGFAALTCWSFPPFAESMSLTNSSVTFGSRPSVCPLSIRTTSATTLPSLQSGYTET